MRVFCCNRPSGRRKPCVRSVGNVSQYTLARASEQGELQANSVVVGANARSILGGRTSRASLHTYCLQIIFIIRLILKVKVQCSKFKVCQSQRSKFNVQTSKSRSLHTLEQLTTWAALITNDLHLAFQSQPFHRATWLISPRNIAEITR